ncbi:MAG: nucleotidyltransferase domain-containing protein [Pirellulales bacterium]|nr:nucleotidyltransferase domain-containing protein [Pirellulales bacterium]
MGTPTRDHPISSVLFSKNRQAVLALLFSHPERSFYLRQIVRACGGGMGAVRRELQQLADAGIVKRTVRDKQVYFQAEETCAIFEELKSIVVKTSGVSDVLRAALAPLSDRIAVAFIFGSVARARPKRGSDVDLAVVGDLDFVEVVGALAVVQERLGREVNPVVYSRDEFRSKVLGGHHFLRSILSEDKIFVLGDEHELERLGAKCLADRA